MLGMMDSALYADITTAVLQSHFGADLKNTGERKYSQWAEFQVVYLIVHCTWIKGLSRSIDIFQFMVMC